MKNKDFEEKIMGRPIKYNKDEWAEKLYEWSKKDDAINLVGFCADNDIPSEYLSVWAKENDNFSQSLKIAKLKIAQRREKLVSEGKLYHGAWQRGAGVYDSILHTHEREEKKYEAEIKQALEKTNTENLIDLLKAINEGKLTQSEDNE